MAKTKRSVAVGAVVTFKNGAKAEKLPSGRYRIISGPTKSTRRKSHKGGYLSPAEIWHSDA